MIYCVEDDRGIRELILYTLHNTGHEARGMECASQFFNALKKEKPRLILLDIMLPGEDGISILKRLKADVSTRKIPVIMITAKDTEFDKVLGLDSGADDYIPKPFGMMELVSRINAVLRRTGNTDGDAEFKYKNIVLNTLTHTVTQNGKPIDLTLKEFELLHFLLKNAGIVMTRENILKDIWGYDFGGETRTVDVHVRMLRSKLKAANIIETVRGVGYRIGGGS